MILRRLRVEHFRCYNLPVEINFDERFTVVAGLNEIGKSTLFDALRYALFRRSGAGGRDIARLEPWGTQGLCASVTVDFHSDGMEYQLSKRWGTQAGTRVFKRDKDGVLAPYKIDGADEFVAGMFAGQPQKQGAFPGFTGQNVGLAYLLFAPQGAMPIAGERKEVELNPDARARLTEIIGAAAQTPDAARIAKKIAEDYASWFTPTGKRKKHSRADQAQVNLATVEAEIVCIADTVARYTDVADDLEAAQLRALSTTSASQAATTNLKALRPRMQLAVTARAELDAAEIALQAARATYQALISKEQRREFLEVQLKQLQPKLSELEAIALDARNALSVAADKRKAAADTLATPVNDFEVRRLDAELESAISEEAKQRERSILLSKIVKANGLQQLLVSAESGYANAGPGDTSDVAKLQELTERERELQLRLEAAETVVSVEPLRDLKVVWRQNASTEVSNVAARESVERRVDGRVTLTIDGVAQIDITGPKGDAALLRGERAQVVAALALFENRLATKSALDLQKRLDAKRQADIERQRLHKELADILEGSTAEALRRRLERLGERSPSAAAADADLIGKLRIALKDKKAQLEAILSGNAGTLRLASDEEASASDAAAHSDSRLRTFQDETVRPVQGELAELVRAGKSESDRKAELDEAYAARHEAERKREKAYASYEPIALRGDPATELSELEERAERLAGEATEAEFEVRELQFALRRMSDQEPEAKLAELEEERDRLHADLLEQERSEEAVRLLQRFTADADARRVSSFAGPVLARVRPWFENVTGRNVEALGLGSNNEMNDLRISGVPRPVDFDELSHGAGDQLALFIRLAFASLLTTDKCLGRMPVLLDDPLVNTDWQRRPRMLDVFAEVAGSAQIIVFTCRPEDYAATPARIVMLGSGDEAERAAKLREA